MTPDAGDERTSGADGFSRTVSWGYPTESAYYRDASSSDSVLAIRVPYFAIQSADDPVSPMLPAELTRDETRRDADSR